MFTKGSNTLKKKKTQVAFTISLHGVYNGKFTPAICIILMLLLINGCRKEKFSWKRMSSVFVFLFLFFLPSKSLLQVHDINV